MADNTTNLDLEIIDRSTEAKTTLVGIWIDGVNNNMKKIDKGFGKLNVEIETKAKIILSSTEPENMDDDTYWLQDIGDSLDFKGVNTESIIFVNVDTCDGEPNDESVYFEEVII